MESGGDAATRAPFWLVVWLEVRPYAQCFLKDWLIGVFFYLLQKSFELLEKLLPLEGWSGQAVANEHAVGTVLAFALFMGLLLKDVMKIQRPNG